MDFLSEIIFRDRFEIENGFHKRDAIIIVLEGTFRCAIQGTQYKAAPGDIYIFPAGTMFQRKVLQPIRCIYFQFEPFPIPLSAGPLSLLLLILCHPIYLVLHFQEITGGKHETWC